MKTIATAMITATVVLYSTVGNANSADALQQTVDNIHTHCQTNACVVTTTVTTKTIIDNNQYTMIVNEKGTKITVKPVKAKSVK
jgi:hypothetical protein